MRATRSYVEAGFLPIEEDLTRRKKSLIVIGRLASALSQATINK